tara:strand:- start:10125 stop:10712 length:588 start_codon:yes stop_codon:yes gene_type:complete
MAFWNAKEAQPKRNYRFKVQLTGPGIADGGIIWYAKTFKPPSYEVSEATHDYLDNKYYWPGRVTWADVTMQLVDPVSPNAVYITNQLLVDAGYKIKDSSTAVQETIGKNKASTAVGEVKVEIVDADGVIIETWTLKNAFLKAASWSDLDYSNDELRTIDMTFRYDWAECLHGTGVPAPAGGTTQFGTNTPQPPGN